MEFRKERNFIVAYDMEVMQGKWNISTGEFIGKSGKPVTSCPRAFVYNNLPYTSGATENTRLGGAIRFYREWFGNNGRRYTEAIGQRLEALLSVGLIPHDCRDLLSTRRLTKDVVRYCKEQLNGMYNDSQVENYLFRAKYQSFLEGRPSWVVETFLRCVDEIPLDFLKSFLNRAENEHIEAFWRNGYSPVGNVTEVLQNYYKKCKEMYGEAKVTPNLLTNYAHINALYKDYSEKHYNEVLTRNNDKPFLYFLSNGYEARPLLTREAFHEEGENQHNCVERLYMEKVHDGCTYVVTVRRIGAPEKSVITCEVNHRGQIVQYYAFANSTPREEAQIAFRSAYAAHLMDSMKTP